MVFAAVGTLHAPPLHRPLIEGIRNGAVPFDGGRTDFHSLGVVEGDLPGHCQLPRVPLFPGGLCPAVALIADDVPDRLRCQGVGLCGAAERENAAGVGFLKDGVAAVPAFGWGYLPAQGRSIPDHGSDAEFGILLRVDGRGVDEQDGAGVLVYDVSNDVVLQLGFSHLGGRDQDLPPDLRVREGIHDLPEVRRPADAVGAGFRAAFRGQTALFLRPLRYRQILRRLHPGQYFREQLVQPPDFCAIRHPRHLIRWVPISSCCAPAPHIFGGHTDTWTAPPSA